MWKRDEEPAKLVDSIDSDCTYVKAEKYGVKVTYNFTVSLTRVTLGVKHDGVNMMRWSDCTNASLPAPLTTASPPTSPLACAKETNTFVSRVWYHCIHRHMRTIVRADCKHYHYAPVSCRYGRRRRTRYVGVMTCLKHVQRSEMCITSIGRKYCMMSVWLPW